MKNILYTTRASKVSSKLVLTLLVSVMFLYSAYPQPRSQKYTLHYKHIKLGKLFKKIETASGKNFLYRVDEINLEREVSINVTEQPLSKILSIIFKDTPIRYTISGNQLILNRKTKKVKKQQLEIKGKVVDKNGVPIPGVKVSVNNGESAVATTAKGLYSIEANPGDKLSFSMLGFKTQTFTLKSGQTTLNVTLQENAFALDMVSVGYGKTNRRDITGSVATVSGDELAQIQTQSFDKALVGKVAGLYVRSTSGGQPGSGARVYIRGLSQIRGDNQPLYVIDGVPIVTTPNTEKLGLINYPVNRNRNPLLTLNPEDIKSVTVLKDASAAAIYGSRGANGVIIITTKKGRRNEKPRFNFSTNIIVQNVAKKYDFLNAPEWINWSKTNAQQTLNNSGVPQSQWPIYYPTEYKITTDPAYFGKANTNWQDLITRKNALWTNYHFSVTGGTSDVNYRVSLGASDQNGVMIEDNFKRYTINTSLDANITDEFKVGTMLNYNYSTRKNRGFSNLSMANFRPDMAPYDKNGNYTTYEGPYGEQYTLLGDGNQTRDKLNNRNLLASIYGELDIIEGLTLKSQLSIGLNHIDMRNFSTSKSSTALFYGRYYSEPGARLAIQANKSYSTTLTNTLTYNKTFALDHHINAVVGVAWNKYRIDANSQAYRGFPDDDILTDINSAGFIDDASSESLESGLNSIFGRINYDYKRKYYLTFSARRDGSTKFGPNNKYGFFPAGAVAWKINKENFFKGIDFVNRLKLRASYGLTGSDNLPPFSYLAYYKSLENGDSYYNGINGIAVTGVPNADIHWEQTQQLDFGLEFGLFDNRLRGEIAYYEKNTSGIILMVPLTYETGAQGWNANVADVSNKGWEFVIGGDIIRNKDLTWTSTLNFSTVKNRVDNLYAGYTNQNGIIEGEPIGTMLGYKVAGIAQTQQEINKLNQSAPGGTYQSSLSQSGDYIFEDVNGDGVANSDDYVPLGQITPDFFGGWNNTLSYKNWQFTLNWNFSYGLKRYYAKFNTLAYVDVSSNPTSLIKDTWSPTHTNAKYARYGSRTHQYRSSKTIANSSYIKLRSASISYTFPKKWFKHTAIDNLRLTVSGNNLWTITDYPGLDPEDAISSSFAGRTTGFYRDTGSSYPNIRTFTLSLNVSL